MGRCNRYYCHYCQSSILHYNEWQRRSHTVGKKHKINVRLYYDDWVEEEAQKLIESTTEALMAGKINFPLMDVDPPEELRSPTMPDGPYMAPAPPPPPPPPVFNVMVPVMSMTPVGPVMSTAIMPATYSFQPS